MQSKSSAADLTKVLPRPRVFGVTGRSNAGKTTLISQIISWFLDREITVSTIKHAHKGFDLDIPGKDSYRMREAGASEVLLAADARFILMREFKQQDEMTLDCFVSRLAPVDLVLVEGFKETSLPKLEVYRPSLGKRSLWEEDHRIVAVATDEQFACPYPTLDLGNPAGVAEFIYKSVFL